MSSEIIVPETPNWLNALEEKREKRLKARLGHETGAGAPCLKCVDKCPGLDLHFWRKACKICRCPKEDHDVPDDDVYGWAQFQLLGSKPNKTKIVLPGKKDEVELEWAPKGQKDTIEKYLKTLPPELLPVKGSQAAQDRKQLLQKQIPVHDIDPSLCHDLNEDEMKKMNEYIAHVKENSVGVGQIVNLSNIIKANLHNIPAHEALIISSRYPKGVPLSEIVQLQHNIAKNLEKQLSISDPAALRNNIPNLQQPQNLIEDDSTQNPSQIGLKMKDINYPGYAASNTIKNTLPKGYSSPNQSLPHDETITHDTTVLPGTNFDPSRTPRQFVPKNLNKQYSTTLPQSHELPYSKFSNQNAKGQSTFTNSEDSIKKTFADRIKLFDSKFSPNKESPKNLQYGYENPLFHNTAPVVQHSASEQLGNNQTFGSTTPLHSSLKTKTNLPNYAAGNLNIYADTQQPSQVVPRSVKDLAYSTYDTTNPSSLNSPHSLAYGDDNIPFDLNISHSEQYGTTANKPNPVGNQSQQDPNLVDKNFEDYSSTPNMFNTTPHRQRPDGPNIAHSQKYGTGPNRVNPSSSRDAMPYGLDSPNTVPLYARDNQNNVPYSNRSTDTNANQNVGAPSSRLLGSNTNLPGDVCRLLSPDKQFEDDLQAFVKENRDNVVPQNIIGSTDSELIPEMIYKYPLQAADNLGSSTANYQNPEGLEVNKYPYDAEISPAAYPNLNRLKQLTPSNNNTNIVEDYLHPSQVNIGAIQDITYPEIRAATEGTNDFYEDYSPDSIREILNNIKLPECHYCKKSFEENEFAVAIDRANVFFHAQCFKCAGCNQSLADNMYLYHQESDNVYCLRDYAKIRGIPRCQACDELIFTKEYCLAENATFHLKHFSCIECDKPLAGQDYTCEDGMPYCLPCFEHSKASCCSSCGNVIKPDEVGCTLNGIHFHPVDECFACKICKKPLMGQKLLLRNEKLFCSHDCFNASK